MQWFTIGRFAASSAERERAQPDRAQLERQRARDAANAAAERAAALESARRELEHAIGTARAARGASVVAVDVEWRQGKSRLIELETGSLPQWARDNRSATDDVNGTDGDL